MLLSIITFLIMPFALCAAAFDAQCGWDAHMSDSQISGRNTRRLIDISVAIHPDSPSWEKSDGMGEYRELVERQDQGGLAFVSKVNLVVHTTTHFDAPSHFLQEAFDSGRGIEAMDLSIMNGTFAHVPFQRLSVQSVTAHLDGLQDLPSWWKCLTTETSQVIALPAGGTGHALCSSNSQALRHADDCSGGAKHSLNPVWH